MMRASSLHTRTGRPTHPVGAEPVEAPFCSSARPEEEGRPFDKLRANGFLLGNSVAALKGGRA